MQQSVVFIDIIWDINAEKINESLPFKFITTTCLCVHLERIIDDDPVFILIRADFDQISIV